MFRCSGTVCIIYVLLGLASGNIGIGIFKQAWGNKTYARGAIVGVYIRNMRYYTRVSCLLFFCLYYLLEKYQEYRHFCCRGNCLFAGKLYSIVLTTSSVLPAVRWYPVGIFVLGQTAMITIRFPSIILLQSLLLLNFQTNHLRKTEVTSSTQWLCTPE